MKITETPDDSIYGKAFRAECFFEVTHSKKTYLVALTAEGATRRIVITDLISQMGEIRDQIQDEMDKLTELLAQ